MRLGLGMRLSDILRGGAAVVPKSTLVDDLVSYWSLDEVSGTRSDLVGDNDLTDNNTVGVAYPGPSGNAASLVAADSTSLSLASLSVTPSGGYTVAAWFNRSAGNTPIYMLNHFLFGYDGGTKGLVYDGSSFVQTDAATLSAGWNFGVMWVDESAEKLFYQVNNATAKEIAYTAPYATPDDAFAIGVAGTYEGRVARVGVWARPLTEGERTSLFNSGAGKAYADLTTAEKVGLVSYWNLDETSDGSGAVTRVDSHGDNDLTDNGTTASATNTATKSGNAASFVAANSEWLSLASGIDLSNTSFSGAIWIKPTTVAFPQMLVTKMTESYPPVFMMYEQDNGAITFIAGPNNSDKSTATTSAGDLVAGEWSFVYYQWNASSKKAGISVNNAALVEGDATTAAITTDVDPLWFGRRSDGQYLNALLDELAIWSRVLTADERAALYNSGDGVTYPFTGVSLP